MARVKKVKTEFEGRISEESIVVEGEGLTPWEPGADLKHVGRGVSRVDGAQRVSGKAQYTADIQLPGMLYGKILRSPHAHARIRKIDIRRAAKVPGVMAILTFQNIPPIPFWGGLSLVLDPTVRFIGDEVACVIAEEEEICSDALEAVSVEYESLPLVLDPEEALKENAPRVHPQGNLFRNAPDMYQRGNLEQGLAEAEVVVEDTFRTQTALHNCMEVHGSVARWDGDQLVIWDSTQNVFGVRAQAAQLLNLPLHRVRVIKQFMGGGFGSKNSMGKYTLLAALGAKRTGRPVKIILDREEENLTAGNRPASAQYLKLGARRDGRLTALHLKALCAAGAYVLFPPAIAGPARQMYLCPHVKTEQYTVFTNTGPLSAFRGPGYVEGTFALESIMDELAVALGLDPMEIRLKNYSGNNQATGLPYSTKRLREAYDRGADLIGWKDRRKETTGLRRRGWGMASQIWGGSGGPPAYALVKVNSDGSATVISGTQDLGTGTKTVLTQIAAEELGLPVEKISVQIGDTELCPFAPLSAGSMTVPSVGPAVRFAAHDARDQILEIGAQALHVPRHSLEIREGMLKSPQLKNPVPLRDVLSGLRNFMIVGRGGRAPNPEEAHVNTFGAQFVEVEVDLQTGELKLNRVVAVHDSGRVLNPLTISSQLEGGILQGLGFALTEQRIVDERFGAVVNSNLEDYKVLTNPDVPEIVAEMVDVPDPLANNLGVKGVGEPPIIPTAAAVANAVADALGIRIKDLPVTRQKILQAVKGMNP